jgi:hypothetical protein
MCVRAAAATATAAETTVMVAVAAMRREGEHRVDAHKCQREYASHNSNNNSNCGSGRINSEGRNNSGE